jgi:hypothetical protein
MRWREHVCSFAFVVDKELVAREGLWSDHVLVCHRMIALCVDTAERRDENESLRSTSVARLSATSN